MRRTLAFILVLMLPLSLALTSCRKPPEPMTADGGIMRSNADYDYIVYKDAGYVTLSAYKGTSTSVTTPAKLDDLPVQKLSSYVFHWQKVELVIVSDGVLEIGAAAFEMCTALTSVTLPKTLTTLGDGAFVSCIALAELRFSGENTSFQIRDGVLYTDNGSTLLLYPNGLTNESVILPDGITRIARRSFEGQPHLKSVALPTGLTTIDESAFAQCTALQGIVLPETLTKIGNGAFSYSGLVAIDLPDSLVALPDQIFWGCEQLITVRLPSVLTVIGNDAFRECFLLLEPEFPATITNIGNVAFFACQMFKNITIPPLVTSLGQQTFAMCEGLTDITIPATVTDIHTAALDGCDTETLTIHGVPGSAAETYATENEFKFAALAP